MNNMELCPACESDRSSMRSERDADGFGTFYWIQCSNCGFRSREHFASEECPQFFQEVRDSWNIRIKVSDQNNTSD